MDKLMTLLGYCGKGWRLFPILERNKIPATEHGLKDATNNFGKIVEWHRENNNYNWGLATGRVVVIDIDPKNGGSTEDLTLPKSLVVKTGSGGLHIYYKNSGLDIRNSASKLSKGIDVRGQGGYVILPPSIHPNGTMYEWLNSMEPTEFPRDLRELLNKRSVTIGGGNNFTQPNKIENGSRNDTLFRLSCSLRNKGLLDESILAAVSIENQKKCSPPLADDEIEKIVLSSMRYAVE